MRLAQGIALVFALAAPMALQAKAKHTNKPPAAFNQARYVYVEAIDGQEFDPRLSPEDRQAIADVYHAIEAWNRYVLVDQRDQADLIFVVRKGRVAEARAGVETRQDPQVTIGSTRNGSRSGNSDPEADGTAGQRPGYGVDVEGDVGPADDLLEVYLSRPDRDTSSGRTRGTMIWQRTLADGLDAPDVKLLKQLKDQVEEAYPVQTASKPQKP